jgi:uncharacterized protein (TIGR02996 family)
MSDLAENELEGALAAVEDGDFDRALDRLLDAWSLAPLPRLADMIDRVSLRSAATRPPLPTRGRGFERAWMQRAASRDAGELGALLSTFADAGANALRLRMRVLLRFRADPRIGREVADLLLAPRHSPSAAQQWLPSALALLDRHFDPRTADGLTRVTGLDVDNRRSTPLRRILDETIRRRTWDLGHPPAWERRTYDRLCRIDRALPTPTPVSGSERLWQAVLASPHDPHPRQVHADFLLAHGDPRGEFIALQLLEKAGELGPEGRRRMNWLERTHAAEWLHDIGWAIVPGSAIFERGFVKHIRMRPEGVEENLALITTTTSWMTIESVADPTTGILCDPRAQSLTAFECSNEVAIAKLEEVARLPNVERLTIHWKYDHPRYRRALEAHPCLPNLRELVVHQSGHASVESHRWIWQGLLGRQLRRLTFVYESIASDPIALALPLLRATNPTIEQVEFEFSGERWCLHRGDERWTEVELVAASPGRGHRVRSAIRALGSVADVRLVIDDALARTLDPELLAAFEHRVTA